ncbi:hypothetical protein RHSIM_Rhsim09G0118300 [Rhododendron simsii]|uniref:Uncharacterized protein n=1 Tax=Rhododendron simsii TaxID=118357 RepID=A0A834GFZ5_RHOSS|nr:hypothetical protein RHSIM_Rhsim09G0118300 [Rhododendron simsii]
MRPCLPCIRNVRLLRRFERLVSPKLGSPSPVWPLASAPSLDQRDLGLGFRWRELESPWEPQPERRVLGSPVGLTAVFSFALAVGCLNHFVAS